MQGLPRPKKPRPASFCPEVSSTNPRAPSTARLLRHLQSSTYIRAPACAPRSRKVSREPIRVELGAWSGGGGRADEPVGRSALGAVGCDWPPLARAAPRTAAAAAAGGSVWRPAAAAAAGSCGREWDATPRPRAEPPRGRPLHSATGLRDPPGDQRQKSDRGTSVGEEAAAATPGRVLTAGLR